MPSWVLYALSLVILIGSGFAENATQQNQTYVLLRVSELVKEVIAPPNTVLLLPTVASSPAATPVSEDEYREVTVKELQETLNMRIEPASPLIHNGALLMVAKLSQPGDSTIQHICSIYKYLKDGSSPIKGWIYVSDPRGLDYFNYASESMKIGNESNCTGAGDCDDFAILMASLVESIGGTTRIIVAYNNSTGGGHTYAEVYLGNLNSPNCQVNDTLNWLKKKYNTDNIITYNDTDTGEVWLNLDWGSDERGNMHPGGPFCKADQKIVITIRGMSKKTPISMPPNIKNNDVLQIPAIRLNITTNVIESNSAEVWYNKGVALGYLYKYDEAIEAFDMAIRLHPNNTNIWNNKGCVLVAQGKHDEAIRAFDEAIRLDPNYAWPWNNKGLALDAQGKHDEAIKAFDEAIRVDPKYA